MLKSKCHLKKNDKIKVITGKDAGKIGKVIRVDRKKQRVLVENINVVKRHTKASATNTQGGILEIEAPINWSNVMLMCSKCVTPTRIKMKKLEDGKKVRICSKCGELQDS